MGGSFQFWLHQAVVEGTPIDEAWIELTEVAFGKDRDTILMQLHQMRQTIAEWDAEADTKAADAARKEAP